MSDGPHRSLPLNRGWKKFAEHADNSAYSADEVSSSLPSPLGKDWKKYISPSLLRSLRDILGDTSQGSLLSDSKIEQLNMLRSAGVGNNFANTLIDCAEDAVRRNLFGQEAVQQSAISALKELAYDGIRSVEEHYLRKKVSQNVILDVRNRMVEAAEKCPYNDISSQLLYKGKLSSEYKINKNTSVDDGPPL